MTMVALYNMLPLRDQTTVGAYRQQQVERLYAEHAERAAVGDHAEARPAVPAGGHRARHLRPHEGGRVADGAREGGPDRARASSALVAESARAAKFGFSAAELDRERRDVLRGYEGAFAERDKEESADLAAEFIRTYTAKEPTPGMTYEYGLVQRFLPEITRRGGEQGRARLDERQPRRARERAAEAGPRRARRRRSWPRR